MVIPANSCTDVENSDEPPEHNIPPEQLRRNDPGHRREIQINHNG